MTRIPSTWWDGETDDGVPVRDLLAVRDIGRVFAHLKRRQINFSEIGRATVMQPSRIREIARGDRRITDYDVLARICTGLQIPRHYMGLGLAPGAEVVPAACLPVLPELDSRELLGMIAAISVGATPGDIDRWLPQSTVVALPSRLTLDDITAVESITDVHRRMDAVTGGGACLQSALGYGNWATQLQTVPSTSDSWSQQLCVALADLHSLIGWMAHDLLRNGLARRHLVQSLVLARNPDAARLRANILYRLGRVSLLERRPQDALHLFGLGQLAAQDAGCHASVVILHNNAGWAYAMLNREEQVRDSLARAKAELALADAATTPAWAQFALVEADAHGITAVVHAALAQHPGRREYAERAVEEAGQAMQLRHPETERRSLAFDVISAATGHLLIEDRDTAGVHALTAVGMAGEGLRSGRVTDRLDALWQIAEPQAAGHDGLTEFGAHLRALHNGSNDDRTDA